MPMHAITKLPLARVLIESAGTSTPMRVRAYQGEPKSRPRSRENR